MPATVAGQGGSAVLDGVLERVTFANPETGYTIARIAPERGAELVTAVGPLLGAQVGEFLRLRGRWSAHPKYGRQFEVHSYATVLPATAAGIQKYLGSGLIKGIGPVMAERMVAHFGVDIMHVIEDEPGRLTEVGGLGPKRTAMIAAAWAEQKAIKEVMIFLQGVGVSTSLAVRIYKKYGDASVSVVRHEPYRLAADVWGIGFKTADTIAAAVGIARDSPERIKAGLAYTLSEAADDGHCYLPAPNLTADAAKILDVPAELITPCLDELTAAGGVIREPVPAAAPPAQAEAAPQVPAVYLPPFYQAERSLAHALLRLHAARADRLAAFAEVDWDKALGWLRGRTGSQLAPEQADAVRLALTSRVAVLTGGPGCGKSFTVRSVAELARASLSSLSSRPQHQGPQRAASGGEGEGVARRSDWLGRCCRDAAALRCLPPRSCRGRWGRPAWLSRRGTRCCGPVPATAVPARCGPWASTPKPAQRSSRHEHVGALDRACHYDVGMAGPGAGQSHERRP